MFSSVISVISRFVEEYRSRTSTRLKVIDAYLLYILLTGVFQFLYCLLVGTFPFNSFLSGFISSVGCFTLAGLFSSALSSVPVILVLPVSLLIGQLCLRIQINPQNKGDFLSVSPERAFADFLFAHTVLHLVIVNFIG